MLASGTRLGSFEILGQLGAGGMGEVYRARDTKLGRDVALKILPDTFNQDPERVARFKREAQVLASLNHPNIAAIYGLDESGGQQFLALELVEGDTLGARIANGAVPVDDALAIARQIVDALEAAHDKGIIHRVLQPANIALTVDGHVKVLDFGLAKALEPAAVADQSMSPTLTFAATQAGVILGTAAYMSPEQAKGRAVDKRSDIWSFGCVLFEMLTGRRAFEGEDVSDTMAAVLRAEPAWGDLPATMPPSLALLIRRCLDKDRRKRIGDVSTIRFLIDEQATLTMPPAGVDPGVDPGADTRVRPYTRRWTTAAVVLGLVAIAAALGGFVALRLRPATAKPIVTKFPVALGDGQQFTNTGDLVVALSPDGSRIAYAANRRLYVRSMADVDAQPIRGTDVNPRRPMFSPDGASLAYFSAEERALKRIAITGGAPVTVATVDSANPPYGGTWSGDSIFFGATGPSNHGIVRVRATGGRLEVVAKVEAEEVADSPQLMPDGDQLLFTLARRTSVDRWEKSQVVVQSMKSGERKVLVEGGSDGRYLKSGHLAYALGGVIFAVRFDLQRLQVVGGPVPVLEGVRRSLAYATGAAQFSVSENGSLAYIPGPTTIGGSDQSVAFLDRNGVLQGLKLPPNAYRDPRLSPDGKHIAVATDDGKEANVWVYDLGGTASIRRLTQGGRNRFPEWSADGQRIAFQTDREGDLAIFSQRADGTGAAERLTRPEAGAVHVPESVSPDGKWLLFGATKDNAVSLMMLSLDDRKIAAFAAVRSVQPINAAFSPDGKWVAYTSREGRSPAQIYVQPFPPTGVPYQVTKEAASSPHHPFWSRNGRELYYIPGSGQFAYVSVTTRPAFAFSEPVSLPRGALGFVEPGPAGTRQNDATPDNRVVAIVAGNPTQVAAPTGAAAQFNVVLNWLEEVKTRVP